MNDRFNTKRQSFFWRSCLFLLPVFGLAIAGFYALRQDRRLAEADAKERAFEIGEAFADAAEKQWQVLAAESNPRAEFFGPVQGRKSYYFEIDSTGRMVFPSDTSQVPDPRPYDLSQLTSGQRSVWSNATIAKLDDTGGGRTGEDYLQLIESKPPGRFAAAALFAVGMVDSRTGRDQQAIEKLQQVRDRFPEEFTESGLPFASLADLRLLKISPPAEVLVSSVCSNAVFQPSFLTPRLLELAGEVEDLLPGSPGSVSHYKSIWADFEFTRKLVEAARDQFRFEVSNRLVVPNVLTLSLGQVYFGLRLSPADATLHRVLVVPVGSALLLGGELPRLKRMLGPLFGVTLGLGGAPVFQEGGSNSPILASLARTEGGLAGLTVAVGFANADQFFAGQMKRTWTFGSLLAVAVVTALLGWLSSLRAFQRQQRLNEMKTNLVSSVSHEFRAPIASMLLMAEGLESGRVRETLKQREYFGLIVRECRRLGGLVENLLDFARIEQERKTYEFEPSDVVMLVEQTVGSMRPYAEQNRMELETVIEKTKFAGLKHQPILDEHGVQQALVNLIDNAMKYSKKESKVSVGLDLISKRDGMNAVKGSKDISTDRSFGFRIWVEDRGGGLPMEEQTRVFDRFYRVGSEMTRTTQGVGIGLSIVKHVVEAHGGTVSLRSAVGQGSRFTMEFPFDRVAGRGST